MRFAKSAPILFAVSLFLFCASDVFAAFGISPPYIKSSKLVPGSHYEQQIILSRSDPTEDAQVQLTVNAPAIESWISVDLGFQFIMPAGKDQFPMVISIDVPKDAKLNNYNGYMSVRVEGVKAEGKVAIALGAQVDIDLTVGEEGIANFLVRSVSILNSLKKHWPLNYFTKIMVSMNVENTGNISASPTKVHLDVYDASRKNLLESGDDLKMVKIEPFKTDSVVAEFSTKLEPGQYFGHAKIFKGEEMVEEWKQVFYVENGAFAIKDRLILAGSAAVFLLIIVIVLVIWLWRKKRRS